MLGGRIEPDDIQLKQGVGFDLPAAGEDLPTDGLEGQLEHIEREAIVKALEQTRYNKTKAAELLGTTFRQLRYRVKKQGSSGPRCSHRRGSNGGAVARQEKTAQSSAS